MRCSRDSTRDEVECPTDTEREPDTKPRLVAPDPELLPRRTVRDQKDVDRPSRGDRRAGLGISVRRRGAGEGTGDAQAGEPHRQVPRRRFGDAHLTAEEKEAVAPAFGKRGELEAEIGPGDLCSQRRSQNATGEQ